jgi:hypothetical protein
MYKATLVWCWAERAKAWDNFTSLHSEPEATGAKCKAHIDKLDKPGVRWYLKGTSARVFETDGPAPGALRTSGIEEQLWRNRNIRPVRELIRLTVLSQPAAGRGRPANEASATCSCFS